MKHRLFRAGAVLICSVLLGALTAPAVSAETVSEDETMAAETEFETEMIGEIETFEFTEESAPYEGAWVDFEEGFKLYVPVEWEITDLSDQQKEEGILFQVTIPTEEEPIPGILVMTDETGGETTLSGIGEKINEAGYVYNGLVKMNGIPCAAYTSAEDMEEDVVGIAFFDPSGEDRLIRAEARCFAEAPSELMTVLMSLTSL